MTDSVKLSIHSCSECPHMVSERHYTSDSFEMIFDWKCNLAKMLKITEHEWNDGVVPIPDWCPLRDKKMKKVGVCCTDGSGIWSSVRAVVTITHLDLAYLDDENLFSSTFGELRAYFDTKTWDVDQEGLIYTDKQWMADFKKLLMKKGFSQRAVESIDYSEQGMQGNDYVSMDVGDTFIIECDKFYNFVDGGKVKKVDITVSALAE